MDADIGDTVKYAGEIDVEAAVQRPLNVDGVVVAERGTSITQGSQRGVDGRVVARIVAQHVFVVAADARNQRHAGLRRDVVGAGAVQGRGSVRRACYRQRGKTSGGQKSNTSRHQFFPTLNMMQPARPAMFYG